VEAERFRDFWLDARRTYRKGESPHLLSSKQPKIDLLGAASVSHNVHQAQFPRPSGERLYVRFRTT
jgi:hypothetical protein